jgi:beta-1,2-mannobiose phosphorylase / 1,2-beta-oligomannan phosphorylase
MTILIYIVTFLLLLVALLVFYIVAHKSKALRSKKLQLLSRAEENPIISPDSNGSWENEAVFNPAAVHANGRVHLFYRALGGDGISRIGYAVSTDGIHFERCPKPVFVMKTTSEERFKNPFSSHRDLRYDTSLHASGGGWGGSEDPRAVLIDDRLHMTFGVFESWESIRIALTSIGLNEVEAGQWNWAPHFFISPQKATNKNWVMFPEKIRGKFAILHALTPDVRIEYFNSPDELADNPIQSHGHRTGRKDCWDAFVRGAAAPPIKTNYGWLLLYHGMNPNEGAGYKVGAMLLDINDPTKILYRSAAPVLEPCEWYENDWKPGVVYASGAVVKDGTLFVYYGGGDKTVNVATASLEEFLQALIAGGQTELTRAA